MRAPPGLSSTRPLRLHRRCVGDEGRARARRASGRWLSSGMGTPICSAPTRAAIRASVAVTSRGLGRDRSTSEVCAGGTRTGRARSVTPSTAPLGGRASREARSTAATRRSRSWARPAPGCPRDSAIGQAADPFEVIRGEPAPDQAIGDPRGERRAAARRAGRASPPLVELRRLFEDRRRRPGAERTRVLAPRELLEARSFAAEALEERRGRQGGQLPQGADAPSDRGGPPSRPGDRAAPTGARTRYAASPPGSTTVTPSCKRQAKSALIRLPAMATRTVCPRSPAAADEAFAQAAPRCRRAPAARWRRGTRDRRRLPLRGASGRARPRAARARRVATRRASWTRRQAMRLIAATRSTTRPALHRDGSGESGLGVDAREAGRARHAHPSCLDALHRDHERGGATGQAMGPRRTRMVALPSTARCSLRPSEGETAWSRVSGPSPRSSATTANPGQRTRRSTARRAAPSLPPHFTQSNRESTTPDAIADAASSASGPSTSATWPPAAVARAIKAQEQAAASGGPGTDDLAELPGGNALSRRSIPRGSHPGGGKDSTEIAIDRPVSSEASNYTSFVE